MTYFQSGIRGNVICAAVAQVVSRQVVVHETPLDGFPQINIDRHAQDSFKVTLVGNGRSSSLILSTRETLAAQKAALGMEPYSDVFANKVMVALTELEAQVP